MIVHHTTTWGGGRWTNEGRSAVDIESAGARIAELDLFIASLTRRIEFRGDFGWDARGGSQLVAERERYQRERDHLSRELSLLRIGRTY
jgi:hypothetical protein